MKCGAHLGNHHSVERIKGVLAKGADEILIYLALSDSL